MPPFPRFPIERSFVRVRKAPRFGFNREDGSGLRPFRGSGHLFLRLRTPLFEPTCLADAMRRARASL